MRTALARVVRHERPLSPGVGAISRSFRAHFCVARGPSPISADEVVDRAVAFSMDHALLAFSLGRTAGPSVPQDSLVEWL